MLQIEEDYPTKMYPTKRIREREFNQRPRSVAYVIFVTTGSGTVVQIFDEDLVDDITILLQGSAKGLELPKMIRWTDMLSRILFENAFNLLKTLPHNPRQHTTSSQLTVRRVDEIGDGA